MHPPATRRSCASPSSTPTSTTSSSSPRSATSSWQGREGAIERGPIARLFGSLANTLLDLGLPRIRSWLRERVGDSADVAAVTMEGGFVHLEGVVLPIGPRGLVSLERATAAIGRKAQREADLPEARLHAFRGVIRFGTTGEASFIADVVFRAAPHPDEAAWIAGELVIERATWTPAPGESEARAMRGSAKLFVTSTDWRLDDGVLESERARVRFAGRGPLDSSARGGGVSAANLTLDEAKVGPFLDAASAILGKTIAVPPGVPIDAGITGDLSFGAEGGGRGELAIDAEGLEIRIRGTVAPDGTELDATVDARARPAIAMRNARVPAKALPRDEDELVLALKITGAATAPMVKGMMKSPEIAFRAGRPRFAPPAAVVHDVVVELASEGDQALARLTARTGAGTLTAHLDVPVREPRKSRAQLWVKDLDAAWVSALLGAIDARITLPRDARASVDVKLTIDTADGEASIVTPRSRIAIVPVQIRGRALDGTHVEGDVAFEDTLTLGLEGLAVRPTNEGSLLFSLDVTGPVTAPEAHGTAGAKRLSLVTSAHEDVVVDLLDVRGPVTLTPGALDFADLRGGHADGSIRAVAHLPFTRGESSTLRLEVDGGSTLIGSLLRFAPRAAAVPAGAKIAGTVAFGGDALVVADVNLLSAAAKTSLATHLVLTHDRRLDGSTVRGHADVADLPPSIVLPVPVRGTIEIDAAVSGAIDAPVAAGFVAADRVEVGPAALTNASAFFRVDREKAVWHELEGAAYGGAIASAGVLRRSGRKVLAKIGVREVGIENLPLGTEAPVVMGRLSASLRIEGSVSAPSGKGRATLDDPFYPVLVRTREALGKYGLEPPHPRGDAPATADIAIDGGTISLRGLRASVPGCVATGNVRVSRDGRLDGAVTVTVDDEYLGTSAVLVIPAVLAERLTIPVRITGSASEPQIDADLAGCFGRFMTENRVSAFVSDAVEEMSSLFGARPARTRPPPPPDPLEGGAAGDDDLVAELEAARASWREMEPRLRDLRSTRRRVRIGS